MPEDYPAAPGNIRDFHRSPGPSGADADLIRGMVEQALHAYVHDLNERVHALPNGGDQVSLNAILPWLAEFIRETTFEAIRFGMSLQAGAGNPAFSSPPAQGGTDRAAQVADDAAGSAAASAPTSPEPQAYATRISMAPGPASAPPPVADDREGPVSSSGGATPWLAGGQVTLLVSPFRHFGDVQRFLEDLGKVPLIYDIKPRRFTAGRLYVILGTEYPDAKALADRLETELAPYRPVTRSVQSDLIEILLRPEAMAAS